MVRQTESHNRPDRAEESLPDSRLHIFPDRIFPGSWAGCHGRIPLPPAPLNTKTSARSYQDPSSRCKAGWLLALIGEALEERAEGRREGGAERQRAGWLGRLC